MPGVLVEGVAGLSERLLGCFGGLQALLLFRFLLADGVGALLQNVRVLPGQWLQPVGLGLPAGMRLGQRCLGVRLFFSQLLVTGVERLQRAGSALSLFLAGVEFSFFLCQRLSRGGWVERLIRTDRRVRA